MSTYDSGISTAAVEPSDLDDYLSYLSSPVADWLGGIYKYLTGETYANTYFGTSLSDEMLLIRERLLSIYNVLSPNTLYLTSNGDVSHVYSSSIGLIVAQGFMGLSTNIKAVTSAIQSLEFNDYSSILSSIYSSVDGLESGLTSANTAIGGVTTAVNNVRTAVNNVVSGLSTVNTSVNNVNTSVDTVNSSVLTVAGRVNGSSNTNYLNDTGNSQFIGTSVNLASINRMGFLGLRNYLSSQFILPVGYDLLYPDGVVKTSSVSTFIHYWLSSSLIGISANIKGSETDNIYTSTLNDNNNTTTTVNRTGLGPLLNTQLSNIGENLGHLAYVFASDDEIKLKQDSEPIMEEVGSIYDDSDSKVKVNADGIGGVKNVVGEFGDFLEVDAGIDDVITIVTNPKSYSWLTQETLNNLDTVGVSTFSRGESWHDRLYNEFYEEYFPERVD